jgi:hypothetical protein
MIFLDSSYILHISLIHVASEWSLLIARSVRGYYFKNILSCEPQFEEFICFHRWHYRGEIFQTRHHAYKL